MLAADNCLWTISARSRLDGGVEPRSTSLTLGRLWTHNMKENDGTPTFWSLKYAQNNAFSAVFSPDRPPIHPGILGESKHVVLTSRRSRCVARLLSVIQKTTFRLEGGEDMEKNRRVSVAARTCALI